MKFAKITSALTIAAVSVALTQSVFAGPPKWAQKNDLTIVDAAVGLSGGLGDFDDNPNDFDILVAAVVATGYAGDPLNGEDDFTVFAPIDNAFITLAGNPPDMNDNGSNEDEVVGALVGLLGLDGIRNVLDYHVTEGVRNSRSVTRARQITMLDGNTINATGGFVEAIGSDAEFVMTDVRLTDGMIHVIETVLLPFAE